MVKKLKRKGSAVNISVGDSKSDISFPQIKNVGSTKVDKIFDIPTRPRGNSMAHKKPIAQLPK